MPPVTESLADLQDLRAHGVRTFVAVALDEPGERVVGTVRAAIGGHGEIEVGRLAVDDAWERRGVATDLMLALEAAYPGAARFVLFTAAQAAGPLALYARLGYSVFRRQEHEGWDMVWLAKDRPAATAPAGSPLH
jgi:ribosomal protein S18 acetylase RimI-like enzyme